MRNQPKLAKLRNLLSVEFNSLEVTLLCQQAYGENDLMFGKFVSRVGIQEGILFLQTAPCLCKQFVSYIDIEIHPETLGKYFICFALDCNRRYVQRAYGDLNKIYLWLLQEIACANTPRETSMIKPFAKINCGFKSEICQECVDCSTRTFCRETCWIFFSVPILFPNTSTHVFAHEHTVRNVFIPKHIIFYIFF